MSKDFPKDELDSVTAPGGRHRAKRTLASRFGAFLRYAGVVAVLSGIGIGVLNVTSNNSQFAGTVGNASNNQAQSFQENGLGVTVIDSTDKKDLATKVAQILFDGGWNVLSAVNVPATVGTVGTGGAVTNSTDARTTIYAVSPTAESAATKVAKALGNYQVVVSSQYTGPITVVLSTDYK
jgi:LytR cell envelope-related transcriptional attenuator